MIFTFLILLIILLYFSKNFIKNTGYCGIITAGLILISGLRGKYVGTDTPTYVDVFLNSSDFSWGELGEYFEKKEPLFRIFREAISPTENYTLFFMIIAIFFCTVIGVLIYKYSKNQLLSFIMFLSMGYFYFSMAGIRQTIAMGFLLLAYMSIYNKKYIKSFIFIMIATGFHISSLLFLIVYIIKILPLNKIYIGVVGLISVGFYFNGSQIVNNLIENIWGDERYYYKEQFGGTSTLFLLILISVCLLIVYRKEIQESITNKGSNLAISMDILSIKMILCSIPLQVLAIHQANAFRAAMILHIVSIIAVPNAIEKVKDKPTKTACRIILLALLLIQFYLVTYNSADIMPYRFFWEV